MLNFKPFFENSYKGCLVRLYRMQNRYIQRFRECLLAQRVQGRSSEDASFRLCEVKATHQACPGPSVW